AHLLAALARAVQAAHEHGLVHGDIRPANVLLAEDGAPKIAQFGLARLRREATEVDAVGPAADVYALGTLLYECLTGRPPFPGGSADETTARATGEEPTPLRRLVPAVPPALETIALKCLEKSPARRYATARELAEDLERYLTGEPILARPPGPLDHMWRWAGR